ncbi:MULTISPECIES: gamma-glutamyltransferase [Fusobacterium]|uniref:gamma-glutamyltransferase n=1 Tax=Fusobacterium TaxID=848 RepID=UPI00147782E2|nr:MULTISPECIES: gamma-glutamyltransferase [Fusobacterium]NME35241.1 gamma-glutamyltransferase [Fusobacterium sp. FSA-380-WT-3A]
MDFIFDALKYSYPSTRRVVYGKKGMVCTSQPLAAQVGLDILKKGGNAVDAAIGVAAALTVLEPTSNGIGGDAFALVWIKDKLYGMNSSGPAPMKFNTKEVIENYGNTMPKYGWIPVTVPGIPSAWAELSKKFGKLSLKEILKPAIEYAEEGFPVSPIISKLWNTAFENYKNSFEENNQIKEEFKPWFETFIFNGKAPQPGEFIKLPNHGKTLRELANTNCESFYRGKIAEKIDEFSKKTGGYLRKEDLMNFKAEFVEPISTNYRGYTVSEIPPNGHGIVTLMALNILEGFRFESVRESAKTIHRQIEAMKLAFVDGQHYVTDSRYMKVTPEKLLSKEYAEKRRKLIGEKAIDPKYGDPSCGGTVYLCTADKDGNMVSYIQSNYMGFGSGIVIPDTGIALHNRGNNFNLDIESENCAIPGKKPYHTIIPGFLSKDRKPIGPFGVMGGFMQPQGHLQVLTNTIDFGMNPQEALDAPRWQWVGGKKIEVERNFPYALTEELIRMGHDIKVVPDSIAMGRGQIIWRNEEGVLVGATEPRTDGIVAAW